MPRITQTLSSFSRNEVSEFFKKAKRAFKNAGLTILCAPCTGTFGRVLLITPRKVGNAPQRNRIRRQLRSLFYQEKLYDQMLDCAIIVRSPAVEYSFEMLREFCVTALSTASKNNATTKSTES
jgi:ribonuclease P protein component